MKLLLTLGIATALAVAGPASADPGVDQTAPDGGFLTSLDAAGIHYTDGAQAVAAAKALCELIGRGEPGLEAIQDLHNSNPGFSLDNSAHFAVLAARAYCPDEL